MSNPSREKIIKTLEIPRIPGVISKLSQLELTKRESDSFFYLRETDKELPSQWFLFLLEMSQKSNPLQNYRISLIADTGNIEDAIMIEPLASIQNMSKEEKIKYLSQLQGKNISFRLTPIQPVSDWQTEADLLEQELKERIIGFQRTMEHIARRKNASGVIMEVSSAKMTAQTSSTPESRQAVIAAKLKEAVEQKRPLDTEQERAALAREIDEALLALMPWAQRVDIPMATAIKKK